MAFTFSAGIVTSSRLLLSLLSSSSSSCRCDDVRFVPALSRFPACLREGRTTCDFDEDGTGTVRAEAGGDSERFRAVAGLPRPFFLKNGTVTFSVDAIVAVIGEAVKLGAEMVGVARRVCGRGGQRTRHPALRVVRGG